MPQNAVQTLGSKDVETVLSTYNPLFKGSLFQTQETTIIQEDLPFYPGMRYLNIADYSNTPPAQRNVIDGPNHHIVLDWTNGPIYSLNQDIPIVLNEDTVSEYVRFFFSHVRGKNGRFIIVENIDDIRWRDEPPANARRTISSLIIPLEITKANNDGSFVINACIGFKDSLFTCEVHVDSDGVIALHDEKLLIEDMPILDDSFGH